MDLDDFHDRYRPFEREIASLLDFSAVASPEEVIASFSPVLLSLFRDDRAGLYLDDEPPVNSEARVQRFLQRAQRLSCTAPTHDELNKAPILERWCGARLGPKRFLLGEVTGHPELRQGARCSTSILFQMAPSLEWARTWNRFYRLRNHMPEAIVSMRTAVMVPAGVKLVDFSHSMN